MEGRDMEKEKERERLTDFTSQVPEFEGAVVAPGHNSGVVQEEASSQHFPTVTCEGVLGERGTP